MKIELRSVMKSFGAHAALAGLTMTVPAGALSASSRSESRSANSLAMTTPSTFTAPNFSQRRVPRSRSLS